MRYGIENMRRCEHCTALRPESKLSRQDTTWQCLATTLCDSAATRLTQILAAEQELDCYRDHWFDTGQPSQLHSQTVPPGHPFRACRSQNNGSA